MDHDRLRRDNERLQKRTLDQEYTMLKQREKNNQLELELEQRRHQLLDARSNMYDDAMARLQYERDTFMGAVSHGDPYYRHHHNNTIARSAAVSPQMAPPKNREKGRSNRQRKEAKTGIHN